MHLGKKKLQELKDNKISIEKLSDRYFINSQYKVEVDNILKLLNEDIYNFKEIVDKCKIITNDENDSCLYKLLRNEELFEELTSSNRPNDDDLRYLLNEIDEYYDLLWLNRNTPLIKYILNEFILNKELVDKFDTMIENHYWCTDRNIHTVFEYIEHYHKNNEEISRLNELSIYVYKFDLYKFNLNRDQKLDLIEVLKNNEISLNRLIDIVDNHLELNYDFESLMNYLKKSEKKSILNI